MRKGFNQSIAASLLLLLASVLFSSCVKSLPLPTDFPVSADIIPAESFIHVAYSSQIPGKHKLDYSKGEIPEGSEQQFNDLMKVHWNIVFTSKQPPSECYQHVEQFCKELKCRYEDCEAPPSQYHEMDTIRYYYTPKDNLAIALMYGESQKMFCLLVIRNDLFDKANYKAASRIE